MKEVNVKGTPINGLVEFVKTVYKFVLLVLSVDAVLKKAPLM